MTIWELVQDALEDIGVPSAANTMLVETGGQLPDEFLVYTLISSPPVLHGDNAELLRSYRVQVSAYSVYGLAELPDINNAMTSAGFTRSGMRELPYNQHTRHFGLALDYIYTQDLTEQDGESL